MLLLHRVGDPGGPIDRLRLKRTQNAKIVPDSSGQVVTR
jgi:hypothetical protein